MSTVSQKTLLPHRVEEWTREHVHYWLTEVIKVDKKYADRLHDEEVSGKELICYEPTHLKELGIKHGPSVRITTKLKEFIKLYEDESNPEHAEVMQGTTVEIKENVSTYQTETPTQKSKKSKGKSQNKIKSENKQDNFLKHPTDWNQEKQDSVDGLIQISIPAEQSKPKEAPESFNQIEETKSTVSKALVVDGEEKPLRHPCSLHPFDQNVASHRYIENYILPPETGPGNLIEPAHEYKFMGRTDDIHVMKKKFNKEVFRFAAGCMNSRTNGTIHFGVADSKNSEYAHGEIIGVSVENKDVIIDHFNQGIKSCFEDYTDDAKACIRQPRFVEVLLPNCTLSGKYVIEVDVVPSHSLVQGKLFYIQTLDEDNQWKKSKEISLFFREGAASRDICKIGNPKELQSEMAQKTAQVNVRDNRRKEAEMRAERQRTTNHGKKLQDLLTCGGNMLGYYNYFIIITNKSHPEQLQHLQFMTTLKLFCVLDFDPKSAVSGSCQKYREVRIANLHKPSQFSGDPGTVANTLNLYKQTSWVFCNGREDFNTESDRPLKPSEWLTNKAGEVQDMIAFLCNPNTLPRGRFLVIFLLLSTVEAMNDPIFDTFMLFYKNLGGSENILSICTSNASFQKWKDFIQTRCEHDISPRSIYDLELSEINGTILKLEQNKSNAERLLPSADGSSVVLQQKDKDIMTSLEVLCENECENIYDESSADFEKFKIETETEFYRGGKVKWWNFYFSELPRANQFIKRDKHSSLEDTIRSQTKDSTNTCVMVNLFHHPGCGGTTMAMHVLWTLRKEFRCAVVKDNAVSKQEVALHVAHLMQCGKSEQSFKTPVLLLVEDSEETENTQELQHSLRKITGETGTFVIILNCIRTNLPEVRYKESVIASVFIKAVLTDKEKFAFETKLKELQETRSFTTENFYSFMILKSNFDPEYVANVASNILKDFKVESKREELFCILALLNSYVAEPAISNSLCADFLGIKIALWGRESVLEKMEPYSCLLIEFEAEEYGGLKAVGFVHKYLATECVKQLEETQSCSRVDIVQNILHCDLFFKTFAVNDVLVQSLKSMLITRQRKTEGDEKDTLFSPLIEDINSKKDGLNKTQEIFNAALQRFNKDFAIPQALARHLYLNEKNFAQAKTWANKAKAIKENSYTIDTVGQVSKSELKYKLECKKQDTKPLTAEELKEYFELAQTATKAFKRAQILAKTDDAPETRNELYRKLSPYNISGYMGEIDTAMIVFDIIKKLPLFEERDPMKDHYIQSFLKGNVSCSNIPMSKTESDHTLISVLQEYEPFLKSLKSQVKEAFNFIEMYYTYTKERGIDDRKDVKNRKMISIHYQNYISLFCSSAKEKQKERMQKPKLSLNMEIEECRMHLEEERADTFPGLLQFLDNNKEKVEMIAEKYSFIYNNSAIKTTKDKTNHLLAHIILKQKSPTSQLAKPIQDLHKLLKEILQDVGMQHQYPEPFYLAILLLWPGRNVEKHDDCKNIKIYVDKLRKLARKHLSYFSTKRSTIAHFFLGTSDGLQRLVPKVSLDRSIEIDNSVRNRNVLWQRAEIFKEPPIKKKLLRVNGTIEQGEVFTEYGNLQIHVRPAFLGRVRSGCSNEKVSFYIGFAMDGPLAYDIQYEDDK